jgi:hypothetical protein
MTPGQLEEEYQEGLKLQQQAVNAREGDPVRRTKMNAFRRIFNAALTDPDEPVGELRFFVEENPDIAKEMKVVSLDLAKSALVSANLPSEKEAIESVIEILTGVSDGGRRRRARRSRLNVKRRGTKRHGRSGKHRKLRKLSTRRR